MELESLNLVELALRMRWPTAVARASNNPKEIFEQDDEGLTVLHWACSNQAPLRFFRELQLHEAEFRTAACTPDLAGMTPLLCACASQAQMEIITFFIETCPESLSLTDKEEWTALHYLACSHRSVEGTLERFHLVLKKVIALDPAIALMRDSSHGITALHSLCDSFQLELHRFYYCANQEMQGEMLLLWEITQTFVTALSSDSNSSILHSLVCLPQCPFELVMIATQILEPGVLVQQDSAGNTPLHLAVAAKSDFFPIFLLQKDATAAAIRNFHGETPFCVATRTYGKYSTLHSILLQSYPSAIEKMELSDALYPTVLGLNNNCTTTMFEVFRANPALVAGRRKDDDSSCRSTKSMLIQ